LHTVDLPRDCALPVRWSLGIPHDGGGASRLPGGWLRLDAEWPSSLLSAAFGPGARMARTFVQLDAPAVLAEEVATLTARGRDLVQRADDAVIPTDH